MRTLRSSLTDRRALLPAFVVTLLAAALVLAPLASAGAPTWSTVRKITESGRPAAGAALATTRSTDHRYLHATWRRNAGKVQFSRSANGGLTWSTPVVIADTEMVFGEPRVAASGNDVWVAWARTYEDPDTGTPGMAIIVRHNGRHGSPTGWDAPIRLTSRTGDVRPASISVTDSGQSIYVVFSDLRNDTTRLMYSHDGGRIWLSTIIGEGFDEDFEGVPTTIPVVAAAGDRVVAAWLAAGNVAMARVSTDGGDHWADAVPLGEGLSTAAARGTRLVVGGTAPEGPWMRMWTEGTWGDTSSIPTITLNGETASAVDLDIVLQTDGRVGAVYSAQVDVDEETADSWQEITWFTSPDNGASWSGPTRVSRAGSVAEAFFAGRPTAVWLESGRLWIAWRQERAADPGAWFFALRERS